MLDGILSGGRPGDRRGFIHKKLLGLVGKVAGVIPTPVSGLIGTAARALAGGRQKELGAELKFGPPPPLGGPGFGMTFGGPRAPALATGDGCIIPGMRRDPGTGKCKFFLGERAGPDGGFEVGEAVMGMYGAGLTPGSRVIDRAVCLKGMQLGDDGVCYNKSQITNKQRMWPAGRRPLLSGGDMRAISIAARAGRRLEGATKRLQRLGMMKKPSSRRGPTQHQRLLEAHVTK